MKKLNEGFTSKGALKRKQGGFALAAELTLMSSIMVAGVTVGMTTLRDSLLAEMEDTAEAIGSLDQSFSYAGVRNGHGTAAAGGSGFRDAIDTNAGDGVGFVFVQSDNVEGGL
jgi:Na+/glutamate symporter|tara:strand:- start:9365 stop:9703 length:339 start_codon:yes stop_codon:yes gene_type:complete